MQEKKRARMKIFFALEGPPREQEAIPEFYARDAEGIPRRWVARIRESMAKLTPAYSSNRVLREYTERLYAPAAAAYCQRADDGSRFGADLLGWQRELAGHWPGLRFGSFSWEHQGGDYLLRVQLYLSELDPEAVCVELYAEGRAGAGPFRQRLDRGEPLAGGGKGFLYSSRVPASRPATDYAARLIPHHAGASVPLEAPWILWRD